MDIDQEKAAELEATREIKEDEVRAKIISEFGFDEVDDAERIDKLTAKEMDSSKKLSAAIGQKIKHRTEAQNAKDELAKVAKAPADAKPAEVDIDKKLEEKLAERDLAEIDVPDDIKKEIKDWAAFKGISIKQAKAAPHITQRIADYEKQQEAEEAAITRTNRSGGSKKSYSLESPPDADMTTAEGQKEWEDWKKWAAKQ